MLKHPFLLKCLHIPPVSLTSLLLSQPFPEYIHHSQLKFSSFYTLQTLTVSQRMAGGEIHPFKPAPHCKNREIFTFNNSSVQNLLVASSNLDKKSQSLTTAKQVLCALTSASLSSPISCHFSLCSQQFGHTDSSILNCIKLPSTLRSLPTSSPLLEALSHPHTPFTWMRRILKCDSG